MDQREVSEANASNPEPGDRGGRLRTLPWLAIAGFLLAIVLVRSMAPRFDFALANVLTVLLAFAAWLALILGLYLSQLSRTVWKVVALLPLLAVLVGWAMFRFDRMDGELRPRFRSRWSPPPQLPSQEATAEHRQGIPTAWLAERESDYPQFLGKNRDGRLAESQLQSDWQQAPPSIAWKQPIGNGWSGFAVQGEVAVTMEQRGEQEWVTAYHVADGQLLWHYAMDARHDNVMGGTGPRATPTLFDNRVYACSAVSRLVCLDLANGKELWTRDLLELGNSTQSEFESQVTWGRSASPLVFDDQVVIPLGGARLPELKTLIALDRHQGQELWRGGQDQISYSSPLLAELHGQRQILLVSETQLASYQPDTGEVLWSSPWPSGSSSDASVSQPLVVDGSRVLLTKGYGGGAQLLQIDFADSSWSAREIWRNETVLRTKFTSAVLHQGSLYGLSDGILECVDLESGQRQWKRGRYRQGQLMLVGEHLLITSESGELALVAASPKEYRELAKFPVVGDVTWNTAALSGNRLLMRNSEEAACVLLPF
ncbi:MAG: PQQ-like beta-propeller repeat protein [Planctomycetales bacterium]|nr:PQQ-like beta-propeller repeat protein [Planctomycetales bacterium]